MRTNLPTRGVMLGLLAWVVSVVGCGGGGDGMPTASCGFADGEPNNEAASATEYALGSVQQGCLSASTDVDHFLVGAPGDQTGGIVRATIDNVGAGTVRVAVYDAAGGKELGAFVADAPGAPVSFFFAISPGGGARIAVTDAGGATSPYSYDLTSSYAPVPDSFEPNDAQQAAAPMTAGTSLEGYLFAGTGEPSAAYDDYYRFPATAGSVKVSLEDLPTDIAARVFLLTADGSELARVSTGQKGGVLAMQPPMPLATADYVIHVSLWADAPVSFGQGEAMPEHFTRPYRLTVTQP